MNNIDILIEKYLHDKLTLQEQNQLSKWLEDEGNQEILRTLEIYWKDHAIDLEEKEQKIKSKLFSRIDNDDIANRKSGFNWKRQALGIAATVILCITTVFSVYTILLDHNEDIQEPITTIQRESKIGEKVTIKLPDGSSVKLNSGSSIKYPIAFTDIVREVELYGEGFFQISKDPQRPFVIHVNKAQIKVLGTSFNVKSDQSSNQVIVGVRSGQVKISNHSENISRILNPNDIVIFDNTDEHMEMKKIEDEELIFGWTNQLLVFKDDHLAKILNVLSNWYGVEFILARNIDTKKVFTSKFDNPNLKTVLESLSYVYNFEYEINDKTVIIN